MSQLELGPPVTRHGREGDLGTRSILKVEMNFLSTASGTIDKCSILTLSPKRHLTLIYCPDQPIRQRG